MPTSLSAETHYRATGVIISGRFLGSMGGPTFKDQVTDSKKTGSCAWPSISERPSSWIPPASARSSPDPPHSARRAAEDVIAHLMGRTGAWAEAESYDDGVTVLVLRAKSETYDDGRRGHAREKFGLPMRLVACDVHLACLNSDAYVEEVIEWMNAFSVGGMSPPAPVEFIGGVHMMPTGSTGYFTAELEPGRNLFISEETADQGVLHEFVVAE